MGLIMSKISNCLLMLEYLENGRKYNIKELAEKIEVSERMVRSYKEELEKAGIFIDSIMGPYGGYVLNQSIKIPLRKFSKEDYEFLKSLEVNEEDKEKLQIIADKVHGIYFESQNENIELKDDIKNYYNNIVILKNEDNIEELGFKDKEICEKFIHDISRLWPRWIEDEDRLCMQLIADIIKRKIRKSLAFPYFYGILEIQVIS